MLEKTLGVPLFQEQAMRLAVVAAGFTPGEADQLRRAMGAWRRPGVIDQFRRKLIDGMRANGFSEEYAEAVFGQIRGFGDYGFPESHAASFALLVYVSAWLKYHYPAAFTAALLNSQPMGFYAPAQLVRNAREHGVEVLPVDVNFQRVGLHAGGRGEGREESGEGETANGTNCRSASRPNLPLSTLHSPLSPPLPSASASTCSWACRRRTSSGSSRRGGRGRSARSTISPAAPGLSRAAIARLAKAGAFGSLRLDRRAALWEALGQDQKELPLFDRKEEDCRIEECKLQIAK